MNFEDLIKNIIKETIYVGEEGVGESIPTHEVEQKYEEFLSFLPPSYRSYLPYYITASNVHRHKSVLKKIADSDITQQEKEAILKRGLFLVDIAIARFGSSLGNRLGSKPPASYVAKSKPSSYELESLMYVYGQEIQHFVYTDVRYNFNKYVKIAQSHVKKEFKAMNKNRKKSDLISLNDLLYAADDGILLVVNKVINKILANKHFKKHIRIFKAKYKTNSNAELIKNINGMIKAYNTDFVNKIEKYAEDLFFKT